MTIKIIDIAFLGKKNLLTIGLSLDIDDFFNHNILVISVVVSFT